MNIKELLLSQNPVSFHYLNRYIKLIEHFQNNPTKEKKFDRHHILPKSMFPDFKKEKWNIIKLSARQHFIAHWMLWRAYRNKEMTYAFSKMQTGNSFQNSYKIKSSKVYENLRKDKSISQSKFMIETWQDDEYSRNHSEKISNKWDENDYRKNQTNNIRNYWNKKSSKEKQKRKMETYWSEEKNRIKRGKKYQIVKTTNEILIIENLTLFCEKENYSRSALVKMCNGGYKKSHKDISSVKLLFNN